MAETVEAGSIQLDQSQFDPEGSGYDETTATYLIKKYPLTVPKPTSYQGQTVRNEEAFQAWEWNGKDYELHEASLNPETGMLLKGLKYPTIDKTYAAEKTLGNQIIKKEDGRYYSVSSPQEVEAGSIQLDRDNSTLTDSAILVHNINPDQQAVNNKKITDQGIDKAFATPAISDANMDTMNQKVAEFQKVSGTKTGDFLSDSNKASLAHDDIDNMSLFEKVIKAIADTAYNQWLPQRPENAQGTTEAGMSVLTGSVSWIPAGISMLQSIPVEELNAGNYQIQNLTQLADTAKKIQEALTYKPTSESGQALSNVIAYPISKTAELGNESRDIWYAKADEAQRKGNTKTAEIYRLLGLTSGFGGEALPFLAPMAAKAVKGHIGKVIKTSNKMKLKNRDADLFNDFTNQVSSNHPPIQVTTSKVDEILANADKTPEEVLSDPVSYHEAKMTGEKVELPVSDIAAMSDIIKPDDVKDMSMMDIPSENELTAKISEGAKTKEVAGDKLKVEDKVDSEANVEASQGNAESQLAKRAEADAIEKKLTEDLGDLSTYKTENMKKWADDAQKIMDNDYEQAKRIAMGEALPPEGVHVASVYEGVKIRALQEGDIATIQKLATESTVPTRLSELGQEIKAADSRIENDPIRAAQEVVKVRKEKNVKTGKAPTDKKAIDDTSQKVKTAKAKLDAHTEKVSKQKVQKFIEDHKAEITKRETRKGVRKATKEALDTEFKSLSKELSKILSPNKLNAGIDPTAIPVLIKMAKNRIESGIVTVEGLVDSIHAEIKDLIEGVTKRDIHEALANSDEVAGLNQRRQDINLKAYKTRKINATTKINEKIAEGDFTKTQKSKTIIDEEGKRLNEEYERAKADFQAASEASGTISKEEITELVRLSKSTADAKRAMEAGGDRIAYGTAKVEYENYVDSLKGENASIATQLKNRVEEAKTTWKENPSQATWDVAKDSTTTITENSIGMVATLDNSFMGRQGLGTLLTHPSAWYPAAKNSFIDFVKVLGKQNAFDALRADAYSRPNYVNGKYEKAGVIAKHEEQYPTSLPDRVPLIGRVFKASEVAFKGSGLRMRMDLFDLLERNASKNGVNTTSDVWLKDTGSLTNSLTARGKWGKRGEGSFVRVMLWAPKMLKANLDVMTVHGAGIGFKTGWARKQAAINLLKIVGETATVMMIANALKPGSVETNPTSPDFGKIKIGDTRFDITAGKAAIITLAARLWTNSTKSSTTGLTTQYGTGFGQKDRLDATLDFFMNKVTPPVSVIAQMLKGENRQGETFTWGSAAYSGFTPISVQNFINLKDDVSADAVAGAIVDIIGISANTYRDSGIQRRDIINKLRQGKSLNSKQQQLYDSMSAKEQKYIDEEVSLTAMQAAFSHLSIEQAIFAFGKASPAEKEELRELWDKKIKDMNDNKDLTDEERETLQQKIDKVE